MKKILLLLIAFALVNFNVTAQSLTLSDTDGNDISNGAITVSGLPSDNELVAYAHVKNVSNRTINVMVSSTLTQTVSGMTYALCWGACLMASTENQISMEAIPMTSNEVNADGFSGHNYPNNVSGVSKVIYTFYDADNVDDKVTVEVTFDVTGVGINNINRNMSISAAYPNPANSETSFNYKIPASATAHITVYNALGVMVKKIQLSALSEQVKLNTTNLASGIYFYSFVVNGNIVKTSKLIIRH